MAVRRLAPRQGRESSLPSAALANPAALPDLTPAVQNTALWTRQTESPDPRSTISAMWASSLVWAAGSLVDLVAITVQNVIARRRQ